MFVIFRIYGLAEKTVQRKPLYLTATLHNASYVLVHIGCGKAARPGLCGGCRVTGLPIVRAERKIAA